MSIYDDDESSSIRIIKSIEKCIHFYGRFSNEFSKQNKTKQNRSKHQFSLITVRQFKFSWPIRMRYVPKILWYGKNRNEPLENWTGTLTSWEKKQTNQNQFSRSNAAIKWWIEFLFWKFSIQKSFIKIYANSNVKIVFWNFHSQ